MLSEAVIVGLLGLLALPISILVTWLVNRRKNISDIFKNITESANTAVDLMQTTMESLAHELEIANQRIDSLSKEIAMLHRQNVLLLEENHALHAKVDELKKFHMGNTGPLPLVSSPLPEHPSSDPAS